MNRQRTLTPRVLRRPRPYPFLLSWLIMFVATSFTPASAATIEGHLFDAATGLPVAQVEVMLPGAEVATLSDPAGFFHLDGVPDQPFTLVISHLGYQVDVVMIDPALAVSDELEFQLQPIYYRDEGVVITASRYSPDIHLTTTNITREDLARRLDEQDIPVLLQTTPGLHASSDAGNGVGYTYLKMRGFDQRRVGVMINGIPLNDPEDHQVYWVDMPDLASSLEDIQVQRGVGNSLGGMSAIGGTVNLVTEQLGSERSGELRLSTGSFGTWKRGISWQSGLLGGRFATGMRLSQLQSDGYRDRSGSEQWAAFWSGRYLTPNSSTQINIYTGHEQSHTAWDGSSAADLAANPRHNPETYLNAIDDFRQPHYELHHRWNLGEGMVLKNTIFYIKGDGFYENLKEERAIEDFGLDSDLFTEPTTEVNLIRRKNVAKHQVGWVPQLLVDHSRGRLVLGGDIYDFHSRHWGEILAVDGLTSGDILNLDDYYSYTGDKLAWSIYLNEQLEIAAGLHLLLDLHYQRKSYDFLQGETGNFRGTDRHGYTVDYDFFNPKGGLFWQIPGPVFGGELGLYGHMGIAHREPTDSDLFDTWQGPDDLGVAPLFADSTHISRDGVVDHVEWSDPQVDEERVLNYEMGLAWRGERLSFTLNGYLMEFENEIVPFGARSGAGEDSRAIKGNAQQTNHRGVELGLTARLTRRTTLTLAASRSWDKHEIFTVYQDHYNWDTDPPEHLRTEAISLGGNPIALFPQHLLNIGLVGDYGSVQGSLDLRNVGKQYLDNTGDEGRVIESHTTVDCGLSIDLSLIGFQELESTRLSGRIRNALDADYHSSGYYDEWSGGNMYIPAAGRSFLLEIGYEF